MTNIEGAAARNVATQGRYDRSGLQNVAAGMFLANQMSGKRGGRGGNGGGGNTAPKTAADWHNEEIAKRYDFERSNTAAERDQRFRHQDIDALERVSKGDGVSKAKFGAKGGLKIERYQAGQQFQDVKPAENTREATTPEWFGAMTGGTTPKPAEYAGPFRGSGQFPSMPSETPAAAPAKGKTGGAKPKAAGASAGAKAAGRKAGAKVGADLGTVAGGAVAGLISKNPAAAVRGAAIGRAVMEPIGAAAGEKVADLGAKAGSAIKAKAGQKKAAAGAAPASPHWPARGGPGEKNPAIPRLVPWLPDGRGRLQHPQTQGHRGHCPHLAVCALRGLRRRRLPVGLWRRFL